MVAPSLKQGITTAIDSDRTIIAGYARVRLRRGKKRVHPGSAAREFPALVTHVLPLSRPEGHPLPLRGGEGKGEGAELQDRLGQDDAFACCPQGAASAS